MNLELYALQIQESVSNMPKTKRWLIWIQIVI